MPATRTATAPTATHVAVVPVEAMVCGRVFDGVEDCDWAGAGTTGAVVVGVDGPGAGAEGSGVVGVDGPGAGAEGSGVVGVDGPGAGAEGSPIDGFGISAAVQFVSAARYSSAVR